jgi:tRNA(Ile)-lysidine synthase
MVSGGADSVAMLRLLAAGETGWSGPLSVLHVNHLLRAEEADADAAFVEALCVDLGVACVVERVDVAAYAAEKGLNLEDAGRRVRYRLAEQHLDSACESACVSASLGRIAVAHTRDDRVETFLMRAITGAGATGLASIPYSRGRIVRPLLDCDREDLRHHLGELGQQWREDATNADTTRLRSLVRHEIVPVAEQVNPVFRETLARSLDLLAADDALLSRLAADFARDFAETTPAEEVAFDRDWMRTLERTMARRVVRSAVLSAFPEASRIESAHIEALVDGLADDDFARDLPDGLRAWTEYGRLVVSQAANVPAVVAPSLLPLPGTADLGQAGRVTAEEVAPDQHSGTSDSVVIDAGDLKQLAIGAPLEGDRMRPLGMDGTRKLSDLLIDSKVPRRHRPSTPVVRDGDRIVWLAGVRMSEEYRVGPETVRAIRITWERPERR